MGRRLECGEVQEEDESREKRGSRGHGVGRKWGRRAEAVSPTLFLFLVPKGQNVSRHLSRWLWKVGRWGGQTHLPGVPIFSQQPEAGQHCGVDSAWLGGALTPRSLCEVLGLSPPSPIFNSSLFGSFLSWLGTWSKGPGQGRAGAWFLMGQGLTHGGTSFRTTPGTRGFLRTMRGGPFLQRLSVLGKIQQMDMKPLENSRRDVD